MERFHSNGKLLITGEYVVLDGATALALPTKLGQSLEISKGAKPGIHWKGFLEDKSVWINTFLCWENLENLPDNDASVEDQLHKILHHAFRMTARNFSESESLQIETYLDFPRNWGLGTSSTLINNIAQWLSIDAYALLKLTFGGSGYDIAAASAKGAILYRLDNIGKPTIQHLDFYPNFSDHIYFVHLNQKMNSRNAIADYSNLRAAAKLKIPQIDNLTSQIISSNTLSEFENLIAEHEQILSGILKIQTVKSRLFSDYSGAIKSLGAWGGDFVLATSETDPTEYFSAKGYNTIIPYSEMIL